MRRREFTTLVAGAIMAWPGMLYAQQMPIVGFLNSASAEGYTPMANAFKRGLEEAGYVEGLRLGAVSGLRSDQGECGRLESAIARTRAAL